MTRARKDKGSIGGRGGYGRVDRDRKIRAVLRAIVAFTALSLPTLALAWILPEARGWLAPGLFYAGLGLMAVAGAVGLAMGRTAMIGTAFWHRHDASPPRPSEAQLRARSEGWLKGTAIAFLLGLALAVLGILAWVLFP